MTAPILALASFCIIATVVHTASIAIGICRLRRNSLGDEPRQELAAVSLVRPLCGLDNYAADTLRSTFDIDYPHYEILFCVATANDPVVPLVEALIAEHGSANARLLIGDDRVSGNPKLNNVVKGWRAARHDWIVLADSNVLMPRDYLRQLFASWRADTGLVASPPVGCRPQGVWAELECAFLNTYQARWQYVIDSFGRGFAQGKTMLWRGAAEVWNRQVRWARLRRASFLPYFLPEILAGGVLPMIAAAIVASAIGLSPALGAGALGTIWYGGEMLLAAAAEWHLPFLYPFYGLMRDCLLPVLFFKALGGSEFVWRGNEMQVERMRPRRMMARVRPRLQEVAAGGRRRLRALRARESLNR
jgi:ceramide glucosyltransferase